jgi:hypothetical protein
MTYRAIALGSVPKGKFARLHPLETPSDVFSNTSYTCLISQASIAFEIGDRRKDD